MTPEEKLDAIVGAHVPEDSIGPDYEACYRIARAFARWRLEQAQEQIMPIIREAESLLHESGLHKEAVALGVQIRHALAAQIGGDDGK